jgi:hypothetical protein
MEKLTHVWESLRNVDSLVEVFDVCGMFGISTNAMKKIAQKWQAAKKNSYPRGAGL